MRPSVLRLALAAVLAPHAAAGAPSFPSHDDYQAGTTTIGVGIGDLDADGDLDLIGANGNGNSVTVMRNRGDGRYDVLASYPAGSGASAVTMRDWNADGFTDVAVACGGSNVFTAYLARGDATLGSRVDVPVGTVSSASDIASDDFDRDGRFDVAMTDPVRGAVGEGPVAVSRIDPHRADWLSPGGLHGLVAADLNGDGIPDLAVSGGDSVSVLLGTGDGTLDSTQGPFAVGSNPVRIAAGDLDNDGRLDLVTANRGPAHSPANTLSVLLGIGGGAFARGPDLVARSGPEDVAVADLDGDGVQDLAAVHVGIPGFVSVFPGSGNGSFGLRVDFGTGASPRAISIADVNGDGREDLATANYFDNTLSVLRNATTVTAVESGSSTTQPLSLSLAAVTPAREVRFTLRGTAGRPATLRLYDVQGRCVARVFEGALSSTGTAHARWDGRTRSAARAASGVYLARLESATEAVTLRVVSLR
jgi:hypothetical protein